MGALSASAQSEVMRKEGQGHMSIMSKHLFIDQKARPVWIDRNDDRHMSEQLQIVVYDQAFNMEKTFSFQPKTFKYRSYRGLATVRPIKQTVTSRDDRAMGNPVGLNSLISFEAYVKDNYDSDRYDFFIDDEGHYACWDRYDRSYQSGDAENTVVLTRCGLYYNPAELSLVSRTEKVCLEYDPSTAVWKKDPDDDGYENTFYEQIESLSMSDYDHQESHNLTATLSQNLFNEDDKYEYAVMSYREVAAPDFPEWCEVINVDMDGNITLQAQIQDKYYERWTEVLNEDGQHVLSLPRENIEDWYIIFLDGKKYIHAYDWRKAESYYVLYLLDNQGTGVSEVLRHKVSADGRSYNVAGIRVAGNAKGIVVKNGVKCLNR